MSTQKLSLKNPVLIGVVVLALVGVVVLNVSTFMPRSGDGQASRGYRVQAHPPVPLDARPAIWKTETPVRENKETSAQLAAAEPARDPFFPVRKQPKATRRAPRKNATRSSAPRSRATRPPVCSAVLLMGDHPLAVIDGKGYQQGQTVRGMTVREITAEAVVLRDAQGKIHRLGIGPEKESQPNYRVVTRARATDEQGRTRLSDQ